MNFNVILTTMNLIDVIYLKALLSVGAFSLIIKPITLIMRPLLMV